MRPGIEASNSKSIHNRILFLSVPCRSLQAWPSVLPAVHEGTIACVHAKDALQPRDRQSNIHLLSAAENAGTAAGRLRLPENADARRSLGVSGEVGVLGMNGFGPGLESSSPAQCIPKCKSHCAFPKSSTSSRVGQPLQQFFKGGASMTQPV